MGYEETGSQESSSWSEIKQEAHVKMGGNVLLIIIYIVLSVFKAFYIQSCSPPWNTYIIITAVLLSLNVGRIFFF